ncbi:enoyl-CoA hydratase/isomerase family protein [Streptomyces flavidovirens]|uniref:enoyl-CoA hydratase/isomerase family protein n=1 Tax=Streptomyces flavidovirens TaxID=67298 RepID=UPI00342B6394
MRCEILPGAVAVVEFSEAHEQNPFSRARMRELTRLLRSLDADDSVACVVLTGGPGRSFGAGGDFNEVSEFTGGDEVDGWIDDITDLYTTIAGISKPVVAAIDGYAIRAGLQIALCCDFRIGSREAKLVMPEFRVGTACNFGGYMLETVVGRSVMQDMLYTCDRVARRSRPRRPAPPRGHGTRRPAGPRGRPRASDRRLHRRSRSVHPPPRQRSVHRGPDACTRGGQALAPHSLLGRRSTAAYAPHHRQGLTPDD